MISASVFSSKIFKRILFLLLFAFAGGAESIAQNPQVDSEEQLMVKMINDYRAQNGLSQLKISISLTRAGDWMGNDMATKNYFGHNDSLGRDPFARIAAFGYTYSGYRGENLAAGYDDAARTFNQWKNSATHNENMLNRNYNVIGISRVYNASSRYKWYWTTDFGSYVDPTFDSGGNVGQSVKTVNAASYGQTIAPDAIAATFGTQLSQSTIVVSTLPLPTLLGGVSVMVNNIAAQLIYVSPAQINYIVPTNLGTGAATVKIINNGNVIGTGTVNVDFVSPSIFTFLSNGSGTPAAQTTFDGASFQPVANGDGSSRVLSVGTPAKPNYLVLYGTGLRRRGSLSGVQVSMGGVPATVTFAGAHPSLMGVDQLNVMMPQQARGRGLVDVIISVDGKAANTVKVNVGI